VFLSTLLVLLPSEENLRELKFILEKTG
jgi:hypothetical protein